MGSVSLLDLLRYATRPSNSFAKLSPVDSHCRPKNRVTRRFDSGSLCEAERPERLFKAAQVEGMHACRASVLVTGFSGGGS